ncbi:MAG TPA: EscU/YscU/HrcU family type III secretion system export apparatus switch protein [Alphaproteobacteria bacterium]
MPPHSTIPPRRNASGESRPLAVALKYDRVTDEAPRVVAKGEGYIAEQIIALARAHGVTIKQDSDLANLLAAVRLDAPIPVEAYIAVAEILSYIYGRRSAGNRQNTP